MTNDGEVQRAVGRLEGNMKNLSDDMQELAKDLKLYVRENQGENRRILEKLDKLETKVAPLPDTLTKQDARLIRVEGFQARLMGVITLGSLTVSSLGAGFWMLLLHFSDVMAFIKKIISGP